MFNMERLYPYNSLLKIGMALRVNSEAVHVRARPVGQPLCPPGCSPVAVPRLWVHTELVADRLVGCVVVLNRIKASQ